MRITDLLIRRLDSRYLLAKLNFFGAKRGGHFRQTRGEFTKFSNNTGYFNPYTLNEWLLRFSLWTYEKTDGYLMVSDLQGVLTEKGYVLTDPVILCKDELRFGTTNMGPEAMERVRVSAKAHLDEMRATV